MSRIVILIYIRSLYPNFLFKRGSMMHIIFVVCLLTLFATSLLGCMYLTRISLEHFAVPFAAMLSNAIGIFLVCLLIVGITYGVKYA